MRTLFNLEILYREYNELLVLIYKALFVSCHQEHGGDLNEAVNAHFTEGDRTVLVLPLLAL